ncbi:MAG: hypothetical protein KJ698_04905, partial [Actinobacteria bacterium]|nr:hypothetical protein [Actinomycetota bacterium]MBU1492797.1 hypothetical protein [Actinomycetota bacterium]
EKQARMRATENLDELCRFAQTRVGQLDQMSPAELKALVHLLDIHVMVVGEETVEIKAVLEIPATTDSGESASATPGHDVLTTGATLCAAAAVLPGVRLAITATGPAERGRGR